MTASERKGVGERMERVSGAGTAGTVAVRCSEPVGWQPLKVFPRWSIDRTLEVSENPVRGMVMATPVSALSTLTTNAADEQLLQATTNAAATAPTAATNNNEDTVTLSAAAQQAATPPPAAAATAPAPTPAPAPAPAPAATAANTAAAQATAPTPPPSYLQVLYLSEEGLTTNQIASDLGISAQAVETYLGPTTAPAPTTNTTA